MFVPVCGIIGLLRNHGLGNSKRNEGYENTLRCLQGTEGCINTESLVSNGSSPFKTNATFTHFKGPRYAEHGAAEGTAPPHTREIFFYEDASLPSPTRPSTPCLYPPVHSEAAGGLGLLSGFGWQAVWWRNKNSDVLFGWYMLTWSQYLHFSSALAYLEQKINSKWFH